MKQPLDFSANVRPVIAHGPGRSGTMPAYSDGRYDYLAEREMVLIAESLHNSPMTDTAGERIELTRSGSGWSEIHGTSGRPLQEVGIAGVRHFQLDTFTWNPATKPVISG